MNTRQPNRTPGRAQAGFTMIEILITFVVLLVGLLGLIGLQARTQQAELESYQRGQALVLLQDMVDRMNSNRIEAKNLVYVTASALGGGGTPIGCTIATGGAADLTGAALDKCEWNNLLLGAAEVAAGGTCDSTSGVKCIGAMVGARGCISYDAATELLDSSGAAIPGTGIQTVAVAWQGVSATFAPATSGTASDAVNCGAGSYPATTQRRIAIATMRIGALKAI